MINLLPHQDDFLYSDNTYTGLIGGLGSGKTFIGILKTISKKLEYPSIDVVYYLPTYPLIRDIAFVKFKEALEMLNIPYELNSTNKDFVTPYGRIIMRSMDKPDFIVGYEVGYSLIDEADVIPTDKMKDIFIRVLARNRSKLPNNHINQLDFVSTPEGRKFLYDFFIKKASDKKTLIKAKTTDNSFLPSAYIEGLIDSYTPLQKEAYINGEFVNITSGLVYSDFEREKNTGNTKADIATIIVGMDFNITKMSAVIAVRTSSLIYVIDEIIDAYDTNSICQILKDRYPKNSVFVYPDASGGSRNTSGNSDLEIIKSFGFRVTKPSKNPFVRDRVNEVNRAFRNKSVLINERCVAIIDALENQSYKNGVPDKQEGHDHINDALGYLIMGSKIKKFRVYA